VRSAPGIIVRVLSAIARVAARASSTGCPGSSRPARSSIDPRARNCHAPGWRVVAACSPRLTSTARGARNAADSSARCRPGRSAWPAGTGATGA